MRIPMIMVCASLATVLSASAGDGTWRPLTRTTSSVPVTYPHHVMTAEVEIEWTCARPRPGLLRLSGVARNSGEREVRFDLAYQYRVVPRPGSPRQFSPESHATVQDACAEAAAGSRS